LLFSSYCTTTTTTTTITTTTTTPAAWNAQQALAIAPVAYGIGGIIAAGAFAAIPSAPPLVSTQGVPPTSPQPGTPFGGGLPIPTSATSIAALALVPFGLIPVAVFPPFSR